MSRKGGGATLGGGGTKRVKSGPFLVTLETDVEGSVFKSCRPRIRAPTVLYTVPGARFAEKISRFSTLFGPQMASTTFLAQKLPTPEKFYKLNRRGVPMVPTVDFWVKILKTFPGSN